MEDLITSTNEHIAIRCADSDRLLARVNTQGIYFFCRQHNQQHMMTWEALDKLHAEILRGEAKQKQVVGL